MSTEIHVNRAAVERLVSAQLARKMRQLAEQVESQAKANCPVETGKLKSSIKATPIQGARGKFLSIRVGSDEPYAGAVENGHSGYTIYPVQKKFLRFPKTGGGFAYARSVVIPARTGVHYLRRALMNVMGHG